MAGVRGWYVGGAAAGEVAGGQGGGGQRRPLGFGLPRSGAAPWPPAIEEEGAGGGGGPAAAAVRPAEGEAALPGEARQPVGGGRRRGRAGATDK